MRSIRWTEQAEEDLLRLLEFLAETDSALTERALAAIRKGLDAAKTFPFACRKVEELNPYVREVVIRFGRAGCVAAFRIADDCITVLGIRHQREDDYH